MHTYMLVLATNIGATEMDIFEIDGKPFGRVRPISKATFLELADDFADIYVSDGAVFVVFDNGVLAAKIRGEKAEFFARAH